MSDLAVRSIQSEQMDAVDLAPEVYARVLRDLARVNRWTLAPWPTLRFLERTIPRGASFTLLDVGFGHGDMLREIANWSRRTGRHARLTGIDLNPRSAQVARNATPTALDIDFRTGDYRGAGHHDVICSSLVAHHMSASELRDFLRYMEQTAACGWIVNDLHRHWLPHLAFPWLARALGVHRIVREDGTLSIARSFRRDEWRTILCDAGVGDVADLHNYFPFRLCVERTR